MLGEIQYVGFNFCPRGWAQASGQILPINQNQALFSLLGTAYGGDGRTSFGLPDYRGRTPIGISNNNNLGQKNGSESITLTTENLPAHTHVASTVSTLHASSARGRLASPDMAVLADDGSDRVYNNEVPNVSMADDALTSTTSIGPAGSATIDNMQPYQVLTACIALQGTFPSRS
jgi:microcystin-dependent protein